MAGGRLALVLVLTLGAIAPAAADGQQSQGAVEGAPVADGQPSPGVLQVRPLFDIAQVYDSNLFSTPTDRQADFITRVTPGLAAQYRSPRLTMLGRYTFDAERFADHSDLTNVDARQHADLELSYRPTSRTALFAGADLLMTQTPGELNANTALTFTRASARRAAAHSSITRQLDMVTTGTLDYVFTEYRIAGGLETRTHAAAIGINRRLSSRQSVDAGYRLEQFFFGRSSVTSHALTLGWTEAITRRASVSVDGGPRVTNGSLAPDLSASVRYQFKPGELAFAYARTQTTVIGLAGTTDARSLTLTTTWNLPQSLKLRVAPARFRSAQEERRADVYQVAVGLSRPIARGLSLDVTFDTYVQQGNLYNAVADVTIPRHDVMIRVAAAPGIRLR
jgi:hypothetical protein